MFSVVQTQNTYYNFTTINISMCTLKVKIIITYQRKLMQTDTNSLIYKTSYIGTYPTLISSHLTIQQRQTIFTIRQMDFMFLIYYNNSSLVINTDMFNNNL